jgi:cellulose synthase (UDP-forming)
MEIGGFQTATITEDIHTSMLIHARGYESRYLNKVLAAGLMPETFAGYLKQRTRWAIGCIQMFLKCNPLTVRGLTIAQRIDYLGSVYYFFHGVPRVICLAAPLSALLLGVSPVHATVADLVHFFGSYFAASLIMMRTVSGGTRNAFWADVYETAMCFSLSKATIATMLRPNKCRPFVVTPKGEKCEKRGIKDSLTVIPHLALFGLLIAGMAAGIRLWLNDRSTPGLEVSLFWAGVNLFLLTLAILAANELPQWRNSFRLPRRLPCKLASGDVRISGWTKDISEHGICVEVAEPMLLTSGLVTAHMYNSWGEIVSLQGLVTRQEKVESGRFEVGVNFLEVDDAGTAAIIQQMFHPPTTWSDAKGNEPGIWNSLWSLFTALRAAWHSRRHARRHFPRHRRQLRCSLDFHGRVYTGYTKDISFLGLAVVFNDEFDHGNGRGLLFLKDMTLKVALVGAVKRGRRTMAQFRVESVDKGKEQWHALNLSAS